MIILQGTQEYSVQWSCSHIEAGVFTVRLLVHLQLVPVLVVLWIRGEEGGGGGGRREGVVERF